MMTNKFSKKIFFFIGTTTELIKLAPIIRELEKRNIDFKIITSGQTKVNFGELDFYINRKSADISFEEKTNKSSVLIFFIWFLKTFIRIPFLKKEFKGLNKKNSYFIVHGDPVSSLLGAILAKYYNLKLVHVESGLRSFSIFEPFPEEICRTIISRLADVHFCPNEWSVNNLVGILGDKINTQQNTQIESNNAALNKIKISNNLLKLPKKKYFIMIVHRQEHVIFGKQKSMKLIKFISNHLNSKLQCIFVTHLTTLNFLTKTKQKLSIKQMKKIKFESRLSYLDFVNLISNAEYIITDGGTNQEEAYYLGLPCLILRNRSERIEGLGKNALISGNNKFIIKKFMANYSDYRKERVSISKNPSSIVVDYLTTN